MDETCKQLRKKYKNYYLAKGTLPSHFDLWSGHASAGIDDVPKAAIPELMKTFEGYTDRLLTVKRHKHRWRLSRSDVEWVWMQCADCDACRQLEITEALSLTRLLVLSSQRKVKEEELRKKQFFTDHPEILLEAEEELVKKQQKLQGQNPRSPKISRLGKDVEKIHLAALLYK